MQTAQQISAKFGCSINQAKEHLLRNAAVLEAMATKANMIGKKVNGYTAEQLSVKASECREAAS